MGVGWFPILEPEPDSGCVDKGGREWSEGFILREGERGRGEKEGGGRDGRRDGEREEGKEGERIYLTLCSESLEKVLRSH